VPVHYTAYTFGAKFLPAAKILWQIKKKLEKSPKIAKFLYICSNS
jgi:hypothetical protein